MDNQIKHRLIDKILSTKDQEVLTAIDQLLDSVGNQSDPIELTKEQKWMLEMSETDLKNGATITHEEMDKDDLAWLKVPV